MGTLTAQRWGDMRNDVDAIFIPMQKQLLKKQKDIEKEAMNFASREERVKFLTEYTIKCGDMVVKAAWKLGDFLWTKYDEKF